MASTTKSTFGKSTYTGSTWNSPRTVGKIIVAETPFARCDLHEVKSEDGSSIISDWLFLEERDAINAVVVDAAGNFIVFKQKKYAIEGETLSPVGGFIDDGETPYAAAKREVREELGLVSPRSLGMIEGRKNKNTDSGEDGSVTDGDTDWIFLGKYRTMANRGGGHLYSYLIKNAVAIEEGGGTDKYIGTGDDESQKVLHLTEKDVMAALKLGEFKEVKWAATLSLSLLHLKN